MKPSATVKPHHTASPRTACLDLVALHRQRAAAKLDANRQVVHGREALVGELQQQARLAHGCEREGGP